MMSSTITQISGLLYLLAMVLYIFFLAFKKRALGHAGLAFGVVAIILQIVAFGLRWQMFHTLSGGSIWRAVPITNLYESLLFFALMLSIIYIILEYKLKSKAFGAFAFGIAGGMVLFIDAIKASSNINPLVPALQSNWLLAHVSLSFIAYSCFGISFIASLIYLIATSSKSENRSGYIVWNIVLGALSAIIISLIYDIIITPILGSDYKIFIANTTNFNIALKVILLLLIVLASYIYYLYGERVAARLANIKHETLEDITYKFIAIGFAIFTIGGLVFGAIWAEKTWGRYWAWDPKETWAFITWIIYGIYLHGRLYNKWTKNKAAILSIIGFIVTIFTFLGVNLLLAGLHSYGAQ